MPGWSTGSVTYTILNERLANDITGNNRNGMYHSTFYDAELINLGNLCAQFFLHAP